MKDRYLYRANRVDNGEWVEGLLTIMWGQLHIINPNDENTAYQIDPQTICQCTGLNDKNGKLICENDIIKHYNDTSHPDKYDNGIVRWNDFNIRFERTSTMFKENVCMNKDCVYEVIGNIFDNQELIEAGKEAGEHGNQDILMPAT